MILLFFFFFNLLGFHNCSPEKTLPFTTTKNAKQTSVTGINVVTSQPDQDSFSKLSIVGLLTSKKHSNALLFFFFFFGLL